ncbi:hypothetical protein P5673_022471 [Acropora cervicornis]|uniref:Uncharacterized protein n=1 Tax=Acropora cervicornis TaxID=6130 RepID=A0AAD9V012_ACRCE|nr:hypothetical protein P5673_022471 [Acropora cervicornis]
MAIEGTASRKVLVKFARKCREVEWEALLRHLIPQLGGPGVIIQIDESNTKGDVDLEESDGFLGFLIPSMNPLDLICKYLKEFMWRRWHGEPHPNGSFGRLMQDIAEQYPL